LTRDDAATQVGSCEVLSVSNDRIQPKTAFVFAGGGSFGAVQVGMLQALASHGIVQGGGVAQLIEAAES
jgi:hypothetical protein